VLLYDIDRIYAPGSGVTTQTKADVDTFLQKLIDAGIRIGFIVGPDMGKIKALTDIMKGVTVHSINFYSKINYIMLEHEFWNPTSLDAPTVLDRNAYNASWSTGAKYLNIPSGQRNKYFWHLTKDHQKLLEEIENELGNNHNWWASLDYISYLKNLDASISPVYYNFTDTDINALTLVPGATPLNILENQREGLAEEFIKKSDYTFLVYYRNAASTNHFIGTNNISGDPNFAFNNASSDYYKRLEAYRNKAAFAKDPTIGFNHIALFSNESISNGCAAFNWLGNWLGGANTYRKVELAYKGQINACATCSTNTVLGGFGWFKYSCIASHNSFTGAQKYDLVSCTQGGQIGLANESIVNGYDIYPNPSNARIKISFNNPNGISKMSIDYVIYKPSGQMVLEGSIGNKDEIDIGRLENGLYLVTLMKDKENVTKKFIKY